MKYKLSRSKVISNTIDILTIEQGEKNERRNKTLNE